VGVSTYRQNGPGRWVTGPFTVMTTGQVCHACREQITPGDTGHRCPDGEVRCDVCAAVQSYWANRPAGRNRPVITIELPE
jgi:hypothetical protein